MVRSWTLAPTTALSRCKSYPTRSSRPTFPRLLLTLSTHSSAKPNRIDSFLKLIGPFGILESTRTGLMALPRSPLSEQNEELEKEAADVVDASTLPPG